jgi:transposase
MTRSSRRLRFMLTKGRVTAAVFIEFLRRLLINATAPVFVIVDGHPTHRAKSVARFVATQSGKLALFFLPPYSPELNPDELVWNDLKSHGTGRKLITSLTQLQQMVISHMRQLQKLPALVRSFFHAPTTRYARA